MAEETQKPKPVAETKSGPMSAEEAQKLIKAEDIPRFEHLEDTVVSVVVKDEATLKGVFGGSSLRFADALVSQCGNVSGAKETMAEDKNHAIAIVAEIAPQDGVEAMLATQMAAVQIAVMRHSRAMAGAETINQLEIQERVFNRLARTFAAQMEALRKHRHGGKQTVTVQHVNVEGGGQAIVGNVSRRGGGHEKP